MCKYQPYFKDGTPSAFKHGKSTPLLKKISGYSVWVETRKRCNNPLHKNYGRYGGVGITVCKEWDKFEKFYEDMGERPSLEHSIDRIDNSKGYFKENCRWATKEEQANNRSSNLVIEFKGHKYTFSQWCKKYNLNPIVSRSRIIEGGWTMEKTISWGNLPIFFYQRIHKIYRKKIKVRNIILNYL